MSERYPERDPYGGRSPRSARGPDDNEPTSTQYGRSRSSRRNARETLEDEDYGERAGGYGGEYGQAMSGNYAGGYDNQRESRREAQGQGGMPGQSYGGAYRSREEWDRDFGMRRYGQRGYGWGGPSADVGDDIYGGYGRYRGGQSWGGGYGAAYEGGSQGYYGGEPGRGFLTRGGRQQWGRFAGRGPKNYTRSDERIRDDINDRLTDDPDLDATDIEVKVSNCDVILGGSVDSREAKRRAEDLADSVSGVRNVQNNLRVQAGDEEAPRATRRGSARNDGNMQ